MPKPPSQTKKLLNNGRLRFAIGGVRQMCSAAEDAAEAMTMDEVRALCDADRDLRRAIGRWEHAYSALFSDVEQRLLAEG